MDEIIDTVQYNAGDEPNPQDLPYPWRQYRHPNGDYYFYHREWRLLTTDDVTDPIICSYIRDAVVDLFQCLENDPNEHLLPNDYEIVITEVSESLATLWMYSRSAGTAYRWNDNTGLEIKTQSHFWNYVSEFPSHHRNLPQNAEAEFIVAVRNVTEGITNLDVSFSEDLFASMITRYNQLTDLRAQGYNTTPELAFLIGRAMPLETVGSRMDDRSLATMMNGIHT